MQWGPSLKAFRAQAKKTGVVPPPLLRMPKLKRFDEIYLDAYNTLSAARESGTHGPSPIRLSEIDAYFRVMGIDERDERVKYVALIQRLDRAYLDHASEQIARHNKKKP